jgi:nucleoside triphosphatase
MAEKVPRVVVGALILDDEGRIFLATGNKWKGKWIVVGGHVDFGESLESAVKREVKEETGFDVEGVERISIQEAIFPPDFFEKRHFIFMNYICKKTGGELKLNEELSESGWFEPKEALRLELNPSTREFVENYIKWRGD